MLDQHNKTVIEKYLRLSFSDIYEGKISSVIEVGASAKAVRKIKCQIMNKP